MKYDKRIKADGKGTFYFVLDAGRYEEGEKKGKRRQVKRRGFKSKREAHEALVEIEYQIQNGTFVDLETEKRLKEEEKTVSEFLDDWLDDKKREVIEDSLRYYMQGIRRINDELGDLLLQDVTKSRLDEFLDKLIDEGVSNTYIDMVFRPLRNIFSEAHEDGVIKMNPLRKVKIPSKRNSAPKEIWSEEETVKFLQSVRERFHRGENRTYIVYAIAIFTGMRIGEILALTWENVNLDEKYIMVKQIVDNWGKLKKRTKSKSSMRMITISDSLVEDLKKQREFQQSEMIKYKYSTDLVVSTKKGNPLVPTNISCKDFANEVSHVLNLKRIKFHDLRHVHASLLLTKGVPAKAVQERLGHSSIAITLDIYSHVVPQLQREVASKLDGILAG